jgi:Rrf2 family protein
MISSKGRYALRVMIDLAEHDNGHPLLLIDIAQRQELSEKYLEGIMAVLSRHGFVSAQRGRGGGYRLTRTPENYTVGSILRLIEGTLAPVSCLEQGTVSCSRASECRTLPLWTKLDQVINDYLDSVTLADLMAQDGGDYVI